MRLLLGGLLLGASAAARALAQADAAEAQRPAGPPAGPDLTAQTRPVAPAAQRLVGAQVHVAPLAAVLAGLLLESSKQVARGADSLDRSLGGFADLVAGSGLPGSGRTRQALAREAERMETRGRAELDRLASVGLAEEQRLAATSEAAFREAAIEIVDDVVALSIERLAESPKIHRMIRQESSTLLDDFLDGLRLWCAHADDRVERAARRVFRRGRPRPPVDPATSGPIAPTVASAPAGPIRGYTEPAGFVSRAAALVLDAVIVTGAAAAGGYLASATLQALRPGILGRYPAAIPLGLFGLLFLVYFLFSWAAVGRTIGMGVVGLKVLTLEGGHVSLPRAVLRYAGYLLSAAFIFLGFLWVLIDNGRLGWLDHVARTKVVRAPVLEDEVG